jgi:hypothetical protein
MASQVGTGWPRDGESLKREMVPRMLAVSPRKLLTGAGLPSRSVRGRTVRGMPGRSGSIARAGLMTLPRISADAGGFLGHFAGHIGSQRERRTLKYLLHPRRKLFGARHRPVAGAIAKIVSPVQKIAPSFTDCHVVTRVHA